MSNPLELMVSDHPVPLRLVTTAAAVLSRRITYIPWGTASYVFGAATEKYKFNGNAEDVPGLYDHNARSYTPSWGGRCCRRMLWCRRIASRRTSEGGSRAESGILVSPVLMSPGGALVAPWRPAPRGTSWIHPRLSFSRTDSRCEEDLVRGRARRQVNREWTDSCSTAIATAVALGMLLVVAGFVIGGFIGVRPDRVVREIREADTAVLELASGATYELAPRSIRWLADALASSRRAHEGCRMREGNAVVLSRQGRVFMQLRLCVGRKHSIVSPLLRRGDTNTWRGSEPVDGKSVLEVLEKCGVLEVLLQERDGMR